MKLLTLEPQKAFASSNDIRLQLELAKNTDILPEVVDYLVDTDRFWIAYSTVEKNNKTVWSSTLAKAARKVKESCYLQSIALHLNTDIETLEFLAELDDNYAQFGAASNPNTPKTILDKLADSTFFYIQAAVYKNPNTSEETRKKIKAKNPWYAFIGARSYYKRRKIKIVASGN